MKQLFLAVIATSLLAFNAEARRDQKREVRQQSRIAQGVQSGELTKREAKKLRKGQKKVDHLQEKAKADGVVTPEEKMRLEKAQDHQSKQIYKQKHDGQERNEVAPAPVPPVPESSGTN